MKGRILLLVIILVLFGCHNNSNPTKTNTAQINVFCAMGASAPVKEICDSFAKANNVDVSLNLAASGTLSRQIENGAPADIFISANKEWMDYLQDKEMIARGTIKILGKNRLAIIGNKEIETTIDSSTLKTILLDKSKIIAVGDPGYVPVGKYAMQVFKNLQIEMEEIEKNLIMARDVSSVLKYVELGEADYGIVYYTEALKSDKVNILATIPDNLHELIYFYVGLTNSDQSMARSLIGFFSSEPAGRIMSKHGYSR